MYNTAITSKREESFVKYCNTLLAVENMSESLDFYRTLFGQEVVVDLGWCKTLTCGLTLQAHFDHIAHFPAERMTCRSHAMELYFETEDFDGFIALLAEHPEVEYLHEPLTAPWHQRSVRIYDPNGHLIEVGESMFSIACRCFDEGMNVAETAAYTQHPEDVVTAWRQTYKEKIR